MGDLVANQENIEPSMNVSVPQPDGPDRTRSSPKEYLAKEDNRRQPWKKIIDSIAEQNKNDSVKGEFFPCRDGFYDHGLGA